MVSCVWYGLREVTKTYFETLLILKNPISVHLALYIYFAEILSC